MPSNQSLLHSKPTFFGVIFQSHVTASTPNGLTTTSTKNTGLSGDLPTTSGTDITSNQLTAQPSKPTTAKTNSAASTTQAGVARMTSGSWTQDAGSLQSSTPASIGSVAAITPARNGSTNANAPVTNASERVTSVMKQPDAVRRKRTAGYASLVQMYDLDREETSSYFTTVSCFNRRKAKVRCETKLIAVDYSVANAPRMLASMQDNEVSVFSLSALKVWCSRDRSLLDRNETWSKLRDWDFIKKTRLRQRSESSTEPNYWPPSPRKPQRGSLYDAMFDTRN